MYTILVFFLLLLLAVVFVQDLKTRTIHVLLPILIFVTSFFLLKNDGQINANAIIVNSIFLILTLLILTIYMSIKNKQFINPFQNFFGLGDFLFYLSIVPLFIVKNYILYFIFSMLFAIGIQLGFKKHINQQSVPLAGLSSLLLLGIVLFDLVFKKVTLL